MMLYFRSYITTNTPQGLSADYAYSIITQFQFNLSSTPEQYFSLDINNEATVSTNLMLWQVRWSEFMNVNELWYQMLTHSNRWCCRHFDLSLITKQSANLGWAILAVMATLPKALTWISQVHVPEPSCIIVLLSTRS